MQVLDLLVLFFRKELFAKLVAFVTIKVSLTGTNLFKMIFARVVG